MGTFTNTSQFTPVSEPPAVSRGGGKRELVLRAKLTGSASYATGGDTVTLPAPDGYTLYELRVTSQPPATRTYVWDQSTSAPKLIAFDAFATQEANATNVSADVIFVEAIYVQ
jgi:hypothetical protein